MISALIVGGTASAGEADRFCEDPAAVSAAGPVGRAVCRHYLGEDVNLWNYDAPWNQDDLTQVDRLGFIGNCFFRTSTGGKTGWVSWLVCGEDVKALDAGALEKEIAAAKLPDGLKADLRQIAKDLLPQAQELAGRMKAESDKSPAFKKLILDGPVASHAAWRATYDKHKAKLDKAKAFEAQAAESKSAVPGCDEELHATIQSYIDEVKPKSRAEVEAALTDDVGYVLTNALHYCHKLAFSVASEMVFDDLMKDAPVRRGPRLSAFQRAMTDLATERQKKKDVVPMDYKEGALENLDPFFKVKYLAKSITSKENWAPLAKLKPAKDGRVEAVFKKEKGKMRVGEWRPTNRVKGIGPDGSIVYEEEWVQTGTAIVDITQYPFMLPKAQTTKLKPGMNLTFRVTSDTDPPSGHLVSAYADKAEKKPLNFYGFWL